ncbi:MAG: 50S ribosomal protein L29 [Candidatus Binatia bacterium]
MPAKTVRELRDLSDQELTARELELREALFRLRVRRGTNQLQSSAALRQTRRDIARVKTIQNERMRVAAQGA